VGHAGRRCRGDEGAEICPGLGIELLDQAIALITDVEGIVSGRERGADCGVCVRITPVTASAILLAVLLALAGGLVAGMFGGWRAARLRPADALATIRTSSKCPISSGPLCSAGRRRPAVPATGHDTRGRRHRDPLSRGPGVVRRIRLHWADTVVTIRSDSHYGRREAME